MMEMVDSVKQYASLLKWQPRFEAAYIFDF